MGDNNRDSINIDVSWYYDKTRTWYTISMLYGDVENEELNDIYLIDSKLKLGHIFSYKRLNKLVYYSLFKYFEIFLRSPSRLSMAEYLYDEFLSNPNTFSKVFIREIENSSDIFNLIEPNYKVNFRNDLSICLWNGLTGNRYEVINLECAEIEDNIDVNSLDDNRWEEKYELKIHKTVNKITQYDISINEIDNLSAEILYRNHHLLHGTKTFEILRPIFNTDQNYIVISQLKIIQSEAKKYISSCKNIHKTLSKLSIEIPYVSDLIEVYMQSYLLRERNLLKHLELYVDETETISYSRCSSPQQVQRSYVESPNSLAYM